MKATLYEILGVPEDASQNVIATAYRDIEHNKLELLRSTSSEDTLNRVKFAHQAFSVLSNPASRARYDEQLLHQRLQRDLADSSATFSEEEQATPPAVDVVVSPDPHPEDVIAWTTPVSEVPAQEKSSEGISGVAAESTISRPWIIAVNRRAILTR